MKLLPRTAFAIDFILRVMVTCLIFPAFFTLPAAGAPVKDPAAEPGAWVYHQIIVPAASSVEIEATGIHTHDNEITFSLGAMDVEAMKRDGIHFHDVTVVGRSRLNTDHAALPPELSVFAQGYGPVPNPYGPIDGQLHGKPGWSPETLTRGTRHFVRVTVPTRFANWVAQQPEALRARYLSRSNYSLKVTWMAPSASAER